MTRGFALFGMAGLGLVVSAFSLAACSSTARDGGDDGSTGDESAAAVTITDAASVTHHSNGSYDVACNDGRHFTGITAADVVDPGLCKNPSNPNDPFDPSSCSGATMTRAEAMAALDISHGVLSKKIGRFTLVRRERACYSGVACSPWRDGTRDVTAPFDRLNATFTTNADEKSYHLNVAGDVSVAYASNQPKLELTGDLFQASWGATFTPEYLSQALDWGQLSPTSSYVTAHVSVPYTWMPSLGCPNGHCEGNESVPGSAGASWAGSALTMKGKATASCVRLTSSKRESLKDANGNAYKLDSEIVALGKFSTISCKAHTCADVGSTCGTASDGCGGALNCGTCTTNQLCDKKTSGSGNACRAMTLAEQCQSAGKVLCPGSFDCWDACNPF